MFRTLLSLLFTVSLTACVIHVGPGSYRNPNNDADSVFGDIRVDSGQTVGNLSTVNGTIKLSYGAVARNVETVNGTIDLDDKVQVTALSSVNGSIRAGKQVKVTGDIETVNGDIELEKGSRITGEITTINGEIELDGVHLENNIVSMNGDLSITSDSVIAGNIIFKRNDGSKGNEANQPKLSIDKEVVLHGKILLERPVKLQLNSAEQEAKVEHLYMQ